MSGGTVGTSTAAVSATLTSDYLPDVMLFKQFTATGNTAPVTVASGVTAGSVSIATTGAPTTATVVAQGSADGGNSWVNLPAIGAPAGSTRYPLVRLSATITGGTSPTVTAAGLLVP